jgi:CRISPR-associated protein Cmx8
MKLQYDLYDLPNSQHRAGLAGLVLLARIMQRLRLSDALEVEVVGPRVRLELEEQHVVALFNYVYDASVEERRQSSPRRRQGEVVPPLRIETEPAQEAADKPSAKQWYIYPQTTPRAAFLRDLHTPDIWLKLWRDLVWETVRGIHRAREPFEQRADRSDVTLARALWKDLQRWERSRKHTEPHLVSLAGPLYIGAMAANPERVQFRDSPDRALLLHCWQAVMGVGEARRLVVERGEYKETTIGYVISIPDVLDLDGFCETFEASVALLGPETAGYRPRDAIVALPLEGGLQYLSSLAAAKAALGEIRFTLAGVDVFCLQKRGNTIPIVAAGRVPANASLLEQYELIRGQYGNLLFRERLVANLLGGRSWHDGFDRLFAAHETDLFIGSRAHGFPACAARRLKADFPQEGGTDE